MLQQVEGEGVCEGHGVSGWELAGGLGMLCGQVGVSGAFVADSGVGSSLPPPLAMGMRRYLWAISSQLCLSRDLVI